MPEKQGIETVCEILAFDPAAIIFTPSGQDEDYQEVAKRLGARRGFRKPVTMEQLLPTIRASLVKQADPRR